jgi:hypothetical protein
MYCKVNNNFGSYNKYYAKDEKFNHKANTGQTHEFFYIFTPEYILNN